jgi:hypothetical protein
MTKLFVLFRFNLFSDSTLLVLICVSFRYDLEGDIYRDELQILIGIDRVGIRAK